MLTRVAAEGHTMPVSAAACMPQHTCKVDGGDAVAGAVGQALVNLVLMPHASLVAAPLVVCQLALIVC